MPIKVFTSLIYAISGLTGFQVLHKELLLILTLISVEGQRTLFTTRERDQLVDMLKFVITMSFILISS